MGIETGPVSNANIVVLSGGVGAARLLQGLVQLVPASRLTAIVNVGDDLTLHGLHISPDIDTIVYTLAGQVSTSRGWGLTGESWLAMEMLERYNGQTWFSIGDQDLGTHLYRTQRLHEGASLSEVTAEVAAAWRLPLTLLPATDDEVRTIIETDEHGDLSFQEYFVKHRHAVAAHGVRFEGAPRATALPAAIEALDAADLIIIAPSNPVVSIDPILAISELSDVVKQRRASTCAVSPIVGGKAIKGPAARLMVERGGEASAVGVAKWYGQYCSALVFDNVDAEHRAGVAELGLQPVVTNTIMSDRAKAAGLAAALLSLLDTSN